MKDYVVRRLLYVVVVLVAVVVVGFLIIELPSGDFVTTLIAQLEARRPARRDRGGRAAAAALRPGQPGLRPLLQVGIPPGARAVRGVAGVQPAGEGADPGAPAGDYRPVDRDAAVHLRGGDPDRDLLGHAPVLVHGLRAHDPGLHRAGHAQLPAGAGADVLLLLLLRRLHRRPVLAAVCRRGLELGQGLGPAEAPAPRRSS